MFNRLLSFLSLFLLLSLIVTASNKCFQHPKPFEKGFMKEVDCNFRDDVSEPMKPVPKNKVVSSGSTTDNGNNLNMFTITLTCQAGKNICSKVNSTFYTAGAYLSNIIKFKQPVTVQASFYSFCSANNDCSKTQITLGQAAAAQSVALKGDDGIDRLYPQALVKQMDLNPKPRITPNDIVAEFNSDANFWFDSNTPITSTQVDFLLVVSHELVHGLGFASAYNDYFSEGTPVALTPNPEIGRTSSGQIALTGFYENIFDKYVTVNNKQTLSDYTKQFNALASNKKFYKSTADLFTNFQSTSQYSLGKDLLTTASTKNSMKINLNQNTLTSKDGSLVLETSLKPFAVGSSISHVDYSTYSNTEDFLMRYELAPGNTLKSNVQKLGKWGSEPYGPSLVAVLEKMGYPTNANPNPIVDIGGGSSASWATTNYPAAKYLTLLITLVVTFNIFLI